MDLESFPNPSKLAALYQDQDWTPPLYDVWSQEQIAKDVEVEETSKEVRVSGEIEEIRKYQKLPDDRTGERAYREATYADEGWARPLFDIWNTERNANGGGEVNTLVISTQWKKRPRALLP